MPHKTNVDLLKHNHELISDQYEDAGLKLQLRWALYNFGRKNFDFIDDVYNRSGINANESLLDIGCNDGLEMLKLRTAGHLGHLIGLDISLSPLMIGSERQHRRIIPMDFIRGSGEDLPLGNDSINSAISLFTLYHVDNPENAIKEMKRVVKPDGTIIIATSSKNNKKRHRQFEEYIAQQTNTINPSRFVEPFNSENAPKLIDKYLSVQNQIHHKTDMVINTCTRVASYLLSLNTMRTAFDPIPTEEEWNEVQKNIERRIEEEIQTSNTHEFIDSIDRTYYICKNNKK